MKKLLTFGVALLSATPAMAQNYYYVAPTSPNAQVSTFPDPAILSDTLSGAATARVQNQQLQNELLRQQIELNRLRLQQQQR